MEADEQRVEGSAEEVVFAAVVETLDERQGDLTDVQMSLTGSEIAHRTNLDHADVLTALSALGNGRLHVKPAVGETDLEVLGLDHTTWAIESHN